MAEFIPVALFDMDGTLCNYVEAILESIEKLRLPHEPDIDPFLAEDKSEIDYL